MENVIIVKEEKIQRSSEGSRSWQLDATMVMKEMSGAQNKTQRQ